MNSKQSGLWVRVDDAWRKVLYTIEHPSGRRYALLPVKGQPDSVAIRTVQRTPWHSRMVEPSLKPAS